MGLLDERRFCPRCAAPLEPERTRVECATCGFTAYPNPGVAASALCVDETGAVLLARRAHEPFAGFWDLPGGFLDEGEEPTEALRRELREEAGLDVEPVRLLGVWADVYGEATDAPATINLCWVTRVLGGDERPDDDVSELRWFPRDALPPRAELAFRNVALVLDAWRQEQAQRPRIASEP